MQKLLQDALASGLLASCTIDSAPQQNSSLEPAKKKQRIEEDSKGWVQLDGIVLSQTEKDQLCNGEWLTDMHVNYAQALLKKKFPHIDGLKNTLLIQKKQERIKQGVQIIHTQGNHWIVASSLRCSKSEIEIFDSLYTPVNNDTQHLLLSLFETNGRPSIKMAETCKQVGTNDCGLFAVATATALAFGLDPVKVQQGSMREHLRKCFEEGSITPFPHS